jgi:hypothetical protein
MKLCFSHIGGDPEVWKFGEVPSIKPGFFVLVIFQLEQELWNFKSLGAY